MDSAEPAPADVERLVLRALGALVVFMLAAGVAAAASEESGSAASGGVTGGSDVTGIEEGAIGPLPGAVLGAYARATRREIATATGVSVAVVSFRRYLTETDARALVPGAKSLLVAAPGGPPRTVTDLAAWAEEERAAATAERAEFGALIPTVDDPAFAAQYRREMARLDRLLERLDPRARVVFGAVVEDDVAELRKLARRREVRLVDLPPRAAGTLTRFRGLRPEETEVANEPPTRD